jgi:hypothetical protein
MDKQQRSDKLKAVSGLAALLPLCLVPTYLHAQATVDPASQPPLLLAPYVLETTNLEPSTSGSTGGTKAYRPWFENGSWTGDLIQYQITQDGIRTRNEANPIGRYPRDGAGWNDFVQLWSARYVFPDYRPYDIEDEVNPDWECIDAVPDYWTTRNIVTFSSGSTRDFLWSNLSAGQRSTIDPALAALPPAEVTEPYPSRLLNFVRGDRSNERCKREGEGWRWRFSLLGAIINSQPVYVPPRLGLNSAQEEILVAPGVVVVGANGGMLHGFDARDGRELFGYVPSMVMPRLNRLTQRSSRLFYFVDGSLRHRNIGAETPRNVVAGGLGGGGRGLYALDVTDPANPTVLFEVSGEAGAFNGGTYNSRMGHVHGRPTIARLPVAVVGGRQVGAWYVVSGNGFGSEDGRAYLTLIPIDGGETLFLPAGTATNNGLSAPALVDATGNGIVDYVYAGDLRGDLWRFDFRGSTVTSAAVPSVPFFSAGAGRPITVEPDVSQHPFLEGHMVYFGTGSLLSREDAIATNWPDQSIYGIWDNGVRTSILESQLVTQELVTTTYQWQVPELNSCGVAPAAETSTSTVRIISNQQPVNWTGTGSAQRLGWRVDLRRNGERLVTRPQIRAERLQFITTNPLDMVNPPGEGGVDPEAGSWMLQLDLETGGISERSPRPLFDLNKNCALDQGDAVVLSGSHFVFPVGLNLGPFNIASPSFARVRSIVDGVYINALQLPPQEDIGLPFEGPLDVTTDVPPGLTRLRPQYFDDDPNFPGEFYPEPVKIDSGSPRREEPSARAPIKPYLRLTGEGPGNRVAGHSSGYNKVHGVPYIDFINLEPRAEDVISDRVSSTSTDALFRLDVGTEYSAPPDGELRPMNPRRAQRELYRATDAIDLDQKFIVVVTNADLSAANEIQIGCRTWNVYEYQTMTMQFLRPQAGGNTGLDLTGFVDQQDRSLVVSLREILGETCTGLPTPTGTLRITPRGRVGNPDDMLGTLPGCVNNTHQYNGTLKTGALTATAAQLFATAPHVTRNFDPATNSRFDGYRWRNGALTIQLLAVTETNPGAGDYRTAYRLQDAVQNNVPLLPTRSGGLGEGREIGWGGIYAKGFTTTGSGNNISIVPWAEENGLLYESSVFWHWGDMTRFTTRGVGDPVLPGCYGDRPPTTLFNRETSRFQQREYNALTEGFTAEEQRMYVEALRDLASSDPGVVQAAIEFLENLFNKLTGSTGAQQNLTLGDYHRMRYYIPNNPDLVLLPIDSGLFELDVDGTPVDVADVERDLLPSLGPNYQPGRRSWIDLVPE